MIFIQIPALTISGIFKYPDPKTTALGGVATGNINAHDAATVAPTIKIKGCTSITKAKGARIGKIMAVVARLEVISVKKFTAAINTNNKTKRDAPSNKVICPPIHSANPLVLNPCAKAKPHQKVTRFPTVI